MKDIFSDPVIVLCIAVAISVCVAAWADSHSLSKLDLEAYQACLQAVGSEVEKCDHVVAALKGYKK